MRKGVILCVDDENIILVSLKDQIKEIFSDKYIIETVSDSEEALDLFKELIAQGVEVPIVISDQIMPGMKGDELLIAIHQLSPSTLNILLTGQASAEAVGNALNKAHLYHYIPKPWDPYDLTLTLEKAAESYSQQKSLEIAAHEQERLNAELNAKMNIFKKFAPDKISTILKLGTYKDYIKLGSCTECTTTIVMIDIKSFTHITESLPAKIAFKLINEFIANLTPFIVKHSGFIDKFIGTGLTILFQSAENSLKAAIEIAQFCHNLHLKSDPNESLYNIGIGVNTGEVIIGTVGEENLLQTTIIGDAVYTCSIVENLTEFYQTPLLITLNTIRALETPSQFNIRNIGMANIKEQNLQIEIFEVLNALPAPLREEKIATLELFHRAIELYNSRRFSEAKALFHECVDRCSHDAASRIYIDIIDTHIKTQRFKK